MSATGLKVQKRVTVSESDTNSAKSHPPSSNSKLNRMSASSPQTLSERVDNDNENDTRKVTCSSPAQLTTISGFTCELTHIKQAIADYARVISLLYAVLLINLSFVVSICEALVGPGIKPRDLQKYFAILLFVGDLWLISLCLTAGLCLRRITDDFRFRYKKYIRTTFLKAGVLIFGMGSCIYEALRIIEYFQPQNSAKCRDIAFLVNPISYVILTAVQTYAIFVYFKLKISKNRFLQAISYFGMMHVFATNISIWFQTLISETKEDIAKFSMMHKVSTQHPTPVMILDSTTLNQSSVNPASASGPANNMTTKRTPYDDECHPIEGGFQNLFGTYLYPCKIEYSLICAAMIFLMWTRVGPDTEPKKTDSIFVRNTDNAQPTVKNDTANGRRPSEQSQVGIRPQGFHRRLNRSIKGERLSYNNHVGTIIGALSLAFGLSGIIYFLVITYKYQMGVTVKGLYGKFGKILLISAESGMFIGNSLLNIGLLLVNLIAAFRMRNMGHMRDVSRAEDFGRFRRHKFIERILMTVTYTGLLLHRLFSLFASTVSKEMTSSLLAMESVVSIISATVQTGFVTFFAFSRRSVIEKDYLEKPGRQCLNIARYLNLALWCTATFGIRHIAANLVQNRYYGQNAWSILYHIFLPLLILFRFHSVICYSDIVKAAYSRKFVNLSHSNVRL